MIQLQKEIQPETVDTGSSGHIKFTTEGTEREELIVVEELVLIQILQQI